MEQGQGQEQYLDERESETAMNKCPNCGANMSYDIESTDLKCGHCGTTIDFDENSHVERRKMTDEITKSHDTWKEGAVFKCDNCGAKSVLDKKDIAKSCAYCGSSHIVNSEELPGIKPDSVIPFQITLDSARQRFMKWIKSKFFAPRHLKQIDNKNENINSMYSSSWSFSANTQSGYNGTLGKHVTTTRYVNGRHVSSTTVRYFRVSGSIAQDYRDFFVQSCDRIPAKMFDKIKPFNLTLLKVYRQEYLSGIIAEHYTRSIDICFNDFAAFVKKDLRHRIIRKHGADTVQSLTINTQYNDKKFNYVLLPVYIANYSYKQKLYNFYINGASGKVVGKYPLSKWKVLFTVLGLGILAGAAVVGLIMFGK